MSTTTSVQSQRKVESQIENIANHESVVQPLAPGMCILFVNGVWNFGFDPMETAVEISRSIGNRRVEHFHNESIESAKSIQGLANKILEVKTICEEELAEGENRPDNICIVILAHSHGAGVLKEAMKNPSVDSSLKRNIRVVTIGGAALVPTLEFKSVENLINRVDFIPFLAHASFDVENLDLDPTLKQILQFLLGLKEKIQEDVLQLNSHKIPGLADRIYTAIRLNWNTRNEVELPELVTLSTFEDVFIKVFNMVMYKITILEPEISLDNVAIERFFQDTHSVGSYLPGVRDLLESYIQEHEQAVQETP